MLVKQCHSIGLLIGSLFVMQMGMAGSAPLPQFTDPAKPIMLQPGQHTITIKLQSNPTTGYSWYWLPSATSRVMTPVSHQFMAANNGLIGAPGVSVWIFKIAPSAQTVPMTGHIGLVYQQPWMLPTAKPVVFTVVSAQ